MKERRMKLKLIRLTLLAAFAGAAITAFSSFIATDEGTTTYYAPNGFSCTYQCWTQLSDGSWIEIDMLGTYTTCTKTINKNSCIATNCAPLAYCPTYRPS